MSLIPQKKTIDSVMSIFTKTIADLEKLGEQHALEAHRQKELAAKAQARKEEEGQAANRAFTLRDKLTNLISE